MLTTDMPFLVASLPQELVTYGNSDRALADWGGELGNRIVGRMKSRLRAYNLELALNVPSVIRAQDLENLSRFDVLRSLRFVHEQGTMDVYCGAVDFHVIELEDTNVFEVGEAREEMCLF
jgi:hypothetical protein